MAADFLSSFVVPDSLISEAFFCEPLTPAHVELDYDAVMSTRVFLRRWSQSAWPEDDFTLQDNLADLEMHTREHRDRIAYTFTMLNSDQSQCLGCIYVNPIGRIASLTSREQAQLQHIPAFFRFWVRESIRGTDFEHIITQELISWFVNSWKMEDVLFSCNHQTPSQIALFEHNGLRLWLELDHPGRNQLLWRIARRHNGF